MFPESLAFGLLTQTHRHTFRSNTLKTVPGFAVVARKHKKLIAETAHVTIRSVIAVDRLTVTVKVKVWTLAIAPLT